MIDKVKLIKLMMMTTSESDNEVLTAIRKVNASLAEDNLNWEEYLKDQNNSQSRGTEQTYKKEYKPYTEKRYTDEEEIEEMFDVVLDDAYGSFEEFIQSLDKFWIKRGYLTEKQYNALKKAYSYRR